MTNPPNNPRHLDWTGKEGWSDFPGLIRRVCICSQDPKLCRRCLGDVNNPSPNDTGHSGGGQKAGLIFLDKQAGWYTSPKRSI